MKQFVLVGHPVGHSVSPAMHAAAYRALGIAAEYRALDCPDRAAVERVLEALRAGKLAGANVTVPWKRLALELADEVDALARNTGAANVLVPRAGGVVAHNTDVGALADRVRALSGSSPRRAAVIGSGGAALAALAALASVGAETIFVTARRFGAEPSAWPNAAQLVALGGRLVRWPHGPEAEWWDLAASCEVVIQATSAGMRGAEAGEPARDVVPWQRLGPSAVALDVVYNPAVTPFLAAAKAAGIRAEGGLPMLVGQAESAIELWTGRRPPRELLAAAAARALEAA
jgi:shikimate dehydrogenase